MRASRRSSRFQELVALSPVKRVRGGIASERGSLVDNGAESRHVVTNARQRLTGVGGELLLALPPTLVVLGAFVLVDVLRHERVLFAPLASSAFLIYSDPAHQMNSVRRMVLSHGIAPVVGLGTAAVLGAGYLAAAVAIIATISVIVPADLVHPPAVSTALGFGFNDRQADTLALFSAALALVVALVFLQRFGLAAVAWAERRGSGSGRPP